MAQLEGINLAMQTPMHDDSSAHPSLRNLAADAVGELAQLLKPLDQELPS
jgi:hypothetical protein